MKKCPYCAEEILPEAVKCRHCGEFLTEQLRENNKVIVETKTSGWLTFLVILSICALLIWILGV